VLAQTGKAQTETRSVTFAKEVAPILQEKCEVCHRADGMAPMPLTTFDEVRPWVRSIKTKVADRVMPPWYVSKTVGIQKFTNDRSLTDDEIATIVRWVDTGARLGNPKDMPPPKQWPSDNVWEFAAKFGRPPDLVIKSPEYKVPAVSQDIWWQPMADQRIPEDRWVAGTETRLATVRARKVVHHATTKLFQKELAAFNEAKASVFGTRGLDPAALRPSVNADDPAMLVDPAPEGTLFSEWAVGKNGELYSEHEAGQFLRAGAQIGFDVHMFAIGEETPAQVEVAFWFYPKGVLPKYRAVFNAFGIRSARTLDIPPGAITRHEAYTVLPAPAIVLNFQPHMHLRGKSFAMEAIYPDGRVEMLNYVEKYAFNWHINYIYAKDVAPVLPKGTIIKTTAWHDNTPANKNNPDPTQWVTYGQRSIDEMAHANEVVVFLTDEDYQRVIAERKQNASRSTQQQP
jgi:hypothetical protein